MGAVQPDDLDLEHVTDHVPHWRLVVAPRSGTFHPSPAVPGQRLPTGAPVGSVRSHRDEVEVGCREGGVLLEWLAAEGDPVGAGQPLARLLPAGQLA